jgi:hypothetical protein
MQKHVSLLAIVAGITAAAWSAQAQVQVDITPEQQSYQARTDAQIRNWIHEENHDATDEERTFIDQHWRRAARLWRIRHLAQQAGDNATVARVDALLARADHVLEEQIHRMRMHAPVMQWAPGSVVVDQAPPPPQQEVQPPAPSPNHRWVHGHWQWNGSRYFWAPGHYMEPPVAGMIYVDPKWENRAGRWVYVDGRWNPGAPPPANVVYEPPPAPPQVIEVQAAPPPPIVEVRPPGPAGGTWIPGYWHWNGSRHDWIGGRWSAGRPGMRWEPDHWVRTDHGYRMEHGRWAR